MHLSTHCMYLPQMYVEFHSCILLLHFQVILLNTRDRPCYIFYYMEHSIHIHVSPALDYIQCCDIQYTQYSFIINVFVPRLNLQYMCSAKVAYFAVMFTE